MKRNLFLIVCISLVSVCFAEAEVSDKNAQLIKAAKNGKLYKENRFSITFDLRDGSNTVGSITLKESDGANIEISTERPGDVIEMTATMHGAGGAIIGVGEGSEIRFLGTFEMEQGKVTGQKNSRLVFRKADGKWAYVSGLGQYEDHGKVTKLGYDRTVEVCLDLLRSKDPILQEGGARDLGRICKSQDAGRVVTQLVAILKDTSVPVRIRRGAIEGLGLIGTADTTKALLTAHNEETDATTKTFIEEALGFCAAYSILGEPEASEKPTDIGMDRLLGKKDGKKDSSSNAEKELNGWVKDNLIRRIDVRRQEAIVALDKASGSPEIKIAETAAMLKKALHLNDIVQMLEKAGAKESEAVVSNKSAQSVKPAGKDGENKNTQLLQAAKSGNLQAVQKLLADGADVKSKNEYGITALMGASQEGQTQVVKLLLEKNVDVNAKTFDGRTALWMATQSGYTEVVRLLLEKGADVNIKTNSGVTALRVAMQEGHKEIVQLLEKASAKE